METDSKIEEPDNNTVHANSIPEADIDMDFNDSLIDFIENNGLKDTNYMISPTSFRAALALAVSGADNDTKDELLKAMGFGSVDEMTEWYDSVLASVNNYKTWLESTKNDSEENRDFFEPDVPSPDGAFDIQNSIWRNTKSEGKLSEKYIKSVNEKFGATAKNVSSDKITDTVNSWIKENTKGLIPSISDDLSYADLILVNTIYLKTAWQNDFYEGATQEGDFKTISGDTVKKDFMRQQDRFKYYEDEKGKFVVLPMNGGINAVFILGDVNDVISKIPKASYEEVSVKLPKFETETSLSEHQLIDFCKDRGANKAFTSEADFSIMSDEAAFFISDIIQKTKISVDEEGIEAAAATAVMMELTSALTESEPKEFTADRPFKYMILTESETPELLFYGQLVK